MLALPPVADYGHIVPQTVFLPLVAAGTEKLRIFQGRRKRNGLEECHAAKAARQIFASLVPGRNTISVGKANLNFSYNPVGFPEDFPISQHIVFQKII